jgi:hypothetical protein
MGSSRKAANVRTVIGLAALVLVTAASLLVSALLG